MDTKKKSEKHWPKRQFVSICNTSASTFNGRKLFNIANDSRVSSRSGRAWRVTPDAIVVRFWTARFGLMKMIIHLLSSLKCETYFRLSLRTIMALRCYVPKLLKLPFKDRQHTQKKSFISRRRGRAIDTRSAASEMFVLRRRNAKKTFRQNLSDLQLRSW